MDITIQGALGSVKLHLPLCAAVNPNAGTLSMLPGAEPMQRGTCEALLANAKMGLSTGWGCQVQADGVGLDFKESGGELWVRGTASSEPRAVALPSGVSFKVSGSKLVALSGPDRQAVGQAGALVSKAMPWRRAHSRSSRRTKVALLA